jgi:hypothetical protein
LWEKTNVSRFGGNLLSDGQNARMSNHKINPLNAELNPICHLLALLGAHHILHISRIRVKPEMGNSKCHGRKDIFACI